MSLVNSLVIGYGNSLRGDDGIGVQVAQIVADWHLPKVRSLSLHQLTPELAAELAQVDLAIFVDAYQGADLDVVKIHPLKPSSSIHLKSHFSDPGASLSLTQALFGKCPQAWWVIVPGISFELSDHLSPLAKQGIKQASQQIRSLVTENMVAQPICTKSV
jgi:hydrogenase maturation protease